MTVTTRSNKQVRFSNRSIVTVVDRLSLCQEQRSKLWYSTEETDLFKVWLSLRVREVRSQLGDDHGALLDEELVTINAAAILGLEKYLSPEITKEYKIRRLALQKAVLEEHRKSIVPWMFHMYQGWPKYQRCIPNGRDNEHVQLLYF